MKKAIIFLIRFYQKTLSRDTGWLSYIYSERICCFHPTCSQYTLEAVERFGVLQGLWLGLKRIVRCHPWNEGGVDLVPKKERE